MKTAFLTERGKRYKFLLLEDHLDALNYSIARNDTFSANAATLWVDYFKEENKGHFSSPSDFVAHMRRKYVGDNALAGFLMEGCTLNEFLTKIADQMDRFTKNILNIIQTGNIARINTNGGFCPIKNLDGFEEIATISIDQMKEFMRNPPKTQDVNTPQEQPAVEENWYIRYEKLPPHKFNHESWCGTRNVSIEIFSREKNCFLESRYELLGYGDATQIPFRPRSGIVIYAFDNQNCEEFWFHY